MRSSRGNTYNFFFLFDTLYLTVKKFYNYIYNKSKVTEEDVNILFYHSKEFIIWNIYKFLDNKDFCSSIRTLDKYLGNAKYFEHEVVMIINSMIWRYGLLLMAKNGIEDKKSQKEIVDLISNINKIERTGRSQKTKLQSKMKSGNPIPEYSTKMINSVMLQNYGKAVVNCYSMERLSLIYYTLVKTLIKIRTGCSEAEIKLYFYINILTICGMISKKNTIDGILEHKRTLYNYGKNI